MLSVSEIYHKYIDQDPIKIFQDGAIKSAIIFFTFLLIAEIFNFDKNLIIITILFIANLAASVLIGNIEVKRKAFFWYIVCAILILNISPYVHNIFEDGFMLIIVVVFLGFLVRGFGDTFNIFPIMIVVMSCICFIRFPLATYNHLSFTIVALLVGLAYYILLISRYKPINSIDIEKIVREFFNIFVKSYVDTFDKAKYRRFTQTKVLEVSHNKLNNIISLQSHGLMFIRKNNQDNWRYFCHNLILFNRLSAKFVLTYKKISLGYIRLGFKDASEAQILAENLEKIFKQTLALLPQTQQEHSVLEKKKKEIDYLKYKLEIAYIEKYQKDQQKKKLLFDSILLLDDIFTSLENIKEAYHDLI
ncbi:hypothetical protein IB642_03550 [Allofrancisella guangzhouensis]|uniref:Membrane protein n=1 Tax=Allofrancisella guangzhouensis TaxID=594679 RepID=A0A0A8E3U0_9GAMM|nr:hypothetical protein [Allofrancisella guangzhouensis]AJC48900.1 membrane protein [Allofrancisella guangzhouensis]MBK2027441.1 hypothetical protein [Allofrancisella guangzhouensis]MBK2044094.1 hypothetical protein [Allofrancisella guangzhouensis]MBK2045852.1 hypothetical protein [Allofrancisella guangzhouensis]